MKKGTQRKKREREKKRSRKLTEKRKNSSSNFSLTAGSARPVYPFLVLCFSLTLNRLVFHMILFGLV